MKTKGHGQNRFLRIVTTPIRALGKARDFYVKSMSDYADRVSYGNVMGVPAASQLSSLPKSFSVNSTRSTENEDYSELLRAASARTMGNRIDLDLLMQQHARQSMPQASVGLGGSKGVPRSCSVGMGRIDEDMPCVFGEEKVIPAGTRSHLKTDTMMYPRSRSYAVGKRSTAVH